MPPRPNVLFVMTDHTNAQAVAPLGPCRTPNLDALVAEGVRFARCYTPNAICSPARASLMTATYPSTHGVWDCTHTQRRRWVDVDPARPHFARNLARAGYRNACFGKWHVEQTNRLGDFGWHEADHTCVALRPVLDGTADPADWQDAHAEFFGQRFVYTQRIVWHGRWKYVFSPGGIDELYDLADDPHETRNLVASLAPGQPPPAEFPHREVLLDMVRRMWRKMHAIGDESLHNTHYATLRTAPVGPGVVEDSNRI